MINVTKTYLPDFNQYTSILKRAWDKVWITNNGELLLELESKLRDYLGVRNLIVASNGTIVLQIALKALNIKKEVITTPFSYVATLNAILWEGCQPVFADIDEKTLCIDSSAIESRITENTEAILATHVYGHPCDVDAIEKIAKKHNLKVIYDAAHAFGCKLNGKSLLSFGDISTCSFHATKIFHTVEGGCLVAKDDEIARITTLFRQFGHIHDDYYTFGINAKNSEFHAAMGLAIFPEIENIIASRKNLYFYYKHELASSQVRMVHFPQNFDYNFAYLPVLFNSENELLKSIEKLNANGISPRRYFHPSLNTLPFIDYQPCPVSEEISKRILCLPFYFDLESDTVHKICSILK